MKKIRIVQAYDFLSTAVQVAEESFGLDLSYNRELAYQSARGFDKAVRRAFVTEEGVYYLFQSPDGLVVLNKFSPFVSVLDNSDFSHVLVDGDTYNVSHPEEAWLIITEPCYPKSMRKHLIKTNTIVF